MTDKYDEAIAILTEDPDQIQSAWVNWDGHPAGCLFNIIPNGGVCLTEARAMPEQLVGHPLEDEIVNDLRIPEDPNDILVPSDLEVFAEWQRRLDKEYPNRYDQGD